MCMRVHCHLMQEGMIERRAWMKGTSGTRAPAQTIRSVWQGGCTGQTSGKGYWPWLLQCSALADAPCPQARTIEATKGMAFENEGQHDDRGHHLMARDEDVGGGLHAGLDV